MLCREDIREATEMNIDRDPVAVALDKHIPNAAAVATQVKYLQRARKKLPSFYAARCIIPSLAFEQSSSEACAERKELCGDSVLDLTCGLGVDAAALSKKFRRVVTLERNEVLAEVARENFSRLGISNIEVVSDSAEHFAETTAESFDWCFADPDRRGADGSKQVLVEDCSPDMTRMIPLLSERGIAKRFFVKLSPLFDVDEAFRVFGRFGRCSVEVVSAGDECKEVLAVIDADRTPTLKAAAVGKGEFSTAWPPEGETSAAESFEPEKYRYLIVPDVALQKGRLVRRRFGAEGFVNSENGFVFCEGRASGEVLGRVFEIESTERYDPRRLRREMKGRRAEIMLRDVPLGASKIMQATGLREGSDLRLAFTSIGGEIWVIRLK